MSSASTKLYLAEETIVIENQVLGKTYLIPNSHVSIKTDQVDTFTFMDIAANVFVTLSYADTTDEGGSTFANYDEFKEYCLTIVK